MQLAAYLNNSMQVEPLPLHGVTIFRTCSIGSIGMRTCELAIFLVTLKISMSVQLLYGSCMPSSPKEYIRPW